MINVENLRKLAQANRESNHELDMNHYSHTKAVCSTTMCVLGNYAARADLQNVLQLQTQGPFKDGEEFYGVERQTSFGVKTATFNDEFVLNHFGITPNESIAIFSIHGVIANTCTTPKQAADYIDKFIAWSIAKTHGQSVQKPTEDSHGN